MNIASAAKIIAFVTHKAKTKTKLPGLHFVLPGTLIDVSKHILDNPVIDC